MMKMTEKTTIITFKNNHKSINSNCVEVKTSIKKKIVDNDVMNLDININKHGDEPKKTLLNNVNILTQEDAVNKFLAGESKNEFNDDLMLSSIDHDSEEDIEFKSDHLILGCNDLDKIDFMTTCEMMEEVLESTKHQVCGKTSNAQYIAKTLKKKSIKCLNKMRIMEDVREGCDVQPSSPGHAELRPNSEDENEKSTPNETSNVNQNGQNEEVIQEDDKSNENIIKQVNNVGSNDPNEDNYSNDSSPPDNQSTKRKKENDLSLVKRLRSEIQENFTSRDKILNEFLEIMDTSNGNTEQLQLQSEQILSEIKTLNELAREKEMEWNNIIHLKKIKEELLLRIERRKQISILNFDKQDGDYETQDCFRSANHSILKANLSTPPKYRPFYSDKLIRNRSLLPRSLQNNLDLNGGLDLRQVRQRPVLDVQTIIADHRQRHPEAVPRRGRRIRNAQSGANGNSSILSFASVALGSGSQMRHNLHDVNNDMNLLLGTMDGNRQDCSRPSSAESATNHQDASSFKDMLVQLAKLSQAERNELIQNAIKPPPPYPEVTVHPVTTTTAAPTNSLLHGILTKSPSKPNNKTSFSPTLARLLTAPERAANSHVTSTPTLASSTHPSNMSISEILSTSKARNEITITPVSSQFETPVKRKSVANMDDDEAEDSADRLVIDEGNEALENRRSCDNSSDIGDEVPQCQGCNQRAAQFVCAGCGNQWYCSRDCQVSAWDEHSELCSG